MKKIKKKLIIRFFCNDEVNMDKLKYMKLCIMLIDKILMIDWKNEWMNCWVGDRCFEYLMVGFFYFFVESCG